MFDENSNTTTLHHHSHNPESNSEPSSLSNNNIKNYFCAGESEMNNTMKLDQLATICAMTEPTINIAAVISTTTSTLSTSSSAIVPKSFNLNFQTASTQPLTHKNNSHNRNDISTTLEIQRTEETKSPLSSSCCSSSIESPSVLSYSTEFVASIFEVAAERCNYEMNCPTYDHTSSDGTKALGVSVLNTVGLSCDDCEPSFRSNPRIKWHRRTNDKFCNECTICGGPFIPTDATRKRKRGFGCHRCQAVFDRADRLLAHSRVHTGIKAYGCPHCPRMFSRKDRWSTHIKRQHSN